MNLDPCCVSFVVSALCFLARDPIAGRGSLGPCSDNASPFGSSWASRLDRCRQGDRDGGAFTALTAHDE